MKINKFIYVTWKEGKYYVAQCLNIDVSSFGKTRKQALKNLKEAVELYLEDIPKSKIVKVEQPCISIQELKYA
ncbi:MAG: type II toxin-antitoxin system HicB family antitoxin [Patescibacteria group bacterium]